MDGTGNNHNTRKWSRFSRKWSTEFGPFLTLGLQLALSVVALFFLGRWLDSELSTAPWLMIIGLLLGAVAGFTNFVRTAIALGKEQDKRAEEKRKQDAHEDR